MKNLLLSAFLLTLLSGCVQLNEIEFNTTYPLIFQSEYTNYAWGYSHSGWMMSGSGHVKRFKKEAAWVFPDSLGYISEKDMQNNLNACDSVLEHVSSHDVNLLTAKALSCVDGPLTTPKNTMADAGEHIFAFYRFEADKNRYKRIILNMTGDFSQENLAANANEIVEWMKNVK